VGNAKATPSKLKTLRPWLEVPEAATYLGHALHHEVTEAEVLRLASDGQLKLSVWFVNPTQASPDSPFTETQLKMLARRDAEIAVAQRTQEQPPSLEDSSWPPGIEQITLSGGPYDLAMIGAEIRSVEGRYQQLTEGPAVELNCLDGTFVDAVDGARFRLWKPNRVGTETTHGDETDWVVTLEAYSPAHGLPEDSVLVLRRTVLDEFVQRRGTNLDKPVGQRERNIFLSIIWTLVKLNTSGIDTNHLDKAAGKIARKSQLLGIKVSRRAVSNHLLEAAHLAGRR
jgi:hypothetical protein